MSKVILQNSGVEKMKFHQSLDMRNTISARGGDEEVNTEFVQERVQHPRSTAPLASPSQHRNSHNSPLPTDPYAALLNNGTLPKLPFRSSAMNYRLNNYQDNNNNSTKFESTTPSNNNITKFASPNGTVTTHNELRIIIIDENWSQYCYRIKVNTPFGKLINRFCQQVKKIDNKSVLFWYQGKNVEDEDTPRTLQVKDGEVIFAHYIKS